MSERVNHRLPGVLLSLVAALLLAFVIGYIGVSGFAGEPIGVEKASAYPGTYVKDITATAKQDASKYWYNWFAHNGYAGSWVTPRLIQYNNSDDPYYQKYNYTIYWGLYWDGKKYGDGALATTMAHEVGHHVQKLVGILDLKDGGQLYTVQTELQADCFAGVYMADAYWDGMLDKNDFGQARNAIYHYGDELPVDDANHHGTGPQRLAWFEYGWRTGDPTKCAGALR
jgi:hypothetical protein